jgi:hypothetical protein
MHSGWLVAAGWFIESVSTGQHVGWDGQRFLVPMVMAGGQRKMSGGGNAGCGGWFTHVGGGRWTPWLLWFVSFPELFRELEEVGSWKVEISAFFLCWFSNKIIEKRRTKKLCSAKRCLIYRKAAA